MIEQELLILGLLKESPRHGYEIKKKIKEILSLFAGIDVKSVYYPLKILEQKDLIQKHTGQQGRRPVRFIYRLTPKGQMRFEELLSESFLIFKRPQFSLDLSLYFLGYINPDIGRRRLRGRIFILNKIARGLKKMLHSQNKKIISPSLVRILEHNLKMLEAETHFLSHLTSSL